jgi:amino acid adenylation domain-containing protein/non-ribosomal peptide synthase protein (TIGR01720 family)
MTTSRASSVLEKSFARSFTPPGHDITVSSAVRAAWAILVSRHSGSPDIVFGATLSGRNVAVQGIENVVGPTITTVPVRVTVHDEETPLAFMHRIQRQATEMMPFEQTGLHEIGSLSEDARAACQFQNLISIHADSNSPGRSGSGDPVHVLRRQLGNSLTLPLALDLTVRSDQIVHAAVQFDEAVVSPLQAESILDQLEHVLCYLTSPEAQQGTVGDITACRKRDETLIRSWNQHGQPQNAAAHALVVELIQQQVMARPDEEAVCAWDSRFSYSQLDRMSSQLSERLASLGVSRGTCIPLYFEKSAWIVVSMLAVLKAGGTFVPLDASHPIKRVQQIIRDVKAPIVLISEATSERLPGDLALQVVVPSESLRGYGPDAANSAVSTPPQSRTLASDTAYILFTSGTTGRPKGVMIGHGALATGVTEHGRALGMSTGVRALQFASFAFDASITEILATLVHGGCVCIPSEDDRTGDIAAVVRAMEINWALLTPSFAALIDHSEMPTLRTLVLGGEAASQRLIHRWTESGTVVFVAYGPTECTVVALVRDTRDTRAGLASRPEVIGRSVGSACYIVDVNCEDRLAPIGGLGELYIEGPILAQGYLNDEARTNQAFIHNPKWSKLKSGLSRRFYKTGDLVRYNEDGTVLFVGRRDGQVKLRGQRVEIGEIEQQLSMIPGIENAVVTMMKTRDSRKTETPTLVAVMSPRSASKAINADTKMRPLAPAELQGLSHSMEQIQDALAKQLPGYMIPGVWIWVDKIPLTSSGKTDTRTVVGWLHSLTWDEFRAAASACNVAETKSEAEAFASSTEKLLQRAWCHVLRLPAHQVGLRQPFSAIGGDSISAMQVVARCRSEGVHFTLKDVLQTKTISSLAQRATLAQVSPMVSTGQNEEEDGDGRDLTGMSHPLTPIQRLFFEHNPGGRNHFNQSFLLRLTRKASVDAVAHALQLLVERHDVLASRFAKKEGHWMQYATGDSSQAHRFRHHRVSSEDAAERIYAESQTSLDILTGPLFAADFINFVSDDDASQSERLFLVAHHLVVDLVSWRVLLRDLESLLRSERLPPQRPLSFFRWSRMQQQHMEAQLQSPVLAAPILEHSQPDHSYWGMHGQRNAYGDVSERRFVLSRECTSTLLNQANDAFRTEPLDIMLAALAYSFARNFRDRQPAVIFNESHGRESWDSSVDLSGTVGWFTILCPVPVTVTESLDMLSVLIQTKDARRRTPDNGFHSFGLHYYSREQEHKPSPEVVFNYAGRFQQLDDPDAILRQLPLGMDSSQDCDPDAERFALIDIGAGVVSESLVFSFSFNRSMNRQVQLDAWTDEFKKTLEECCVQLAHIAPRATPSDFPLATIDLPTSECLDQYFTTTLRQHGLSLDAVEDLYPCSPMQNGLLLSQSKRIGVYDLEIIWKVSRSDTVSDSVSVPQLLRAWQRVVDEQPSLRTIFAPSFSSQDVAFNQIVLKTATPEVLNIRSDTKDDALEALRGLTRVTTTDAGKPPHRLAVCVESSGSVYCKLEINHALVDAASIPALLLHLSQAYGNDTVPAAVVPYSQYISFIQGQNPEEAMSYWRTYLSGIEPCIFPALDDGLPTTKRQLQTASVSVTNTMSEFDAFCRSHGITLATLVMAAWAVVLHAYVGTDDVAFGYLASGRDIPISGVEHAVGPFINMLVCRVQLGPAAPLTEVLKSMSSNYADSLEYQHCSMAAIQHGLAVSGQPLFNTVLSIQRQGLAQGPSATAKGLTFEAMDGQDPTDVSLFVTLSRNADS